MDHGSNTPANGIHGVIALPYANAAARLAVASFPTTYLYRVAIDEDTELQWLLASVSPARWIPLGSIATGLRATAIAISTENISSLSGLDKIADGVTLDTDGYRVLLDGQDTATQNGLWEVHELAWVRSSDYSANTHVSGSIVPILSGVTYKGTLWMCDAPAGSDVVGTDNLHFVCVGGAPTNIKVSFDIDLTVAGNVVIDTRPAVPTGPGRWKLVSIDLRIKEALSGGTAPVAHLTIGSESAGNQVVTDQTINESVAVGSIIGGFALSSLGSDMSQSTGFEAMYPAEQQLFAGVSNTGVPTAGVVTAVMIWNAMP